MLEQPPARPLRVLIVEDDVAGHAMEMLLDRCGAATTWVGSAEDALVVVERDRFDVALVDHVLPGMTGAELIARVRASARRDLQALPIVGISGKLGTEQTMMGAGASCFIQKSSDASGIVKAIRWVLAVYRDAGAGATGRASSSA